MNPLAWMNPGVWLAILIAIATGSGAGYWHRGTVDDAKYAAAQAKADLAATLKYNTISQELENVKGQRITVQRTITLYRDKIIDRPVYRNACLDGDGRLLINAAIRGTDPGKPVAAVPAVK
jgi:hypothetical protein